jgi:hypothetical protein
MGQTQTQELYHLATRLEKNLQESEHSDEHTRLCYQIILAMRSAAPNVKSVSGKREVLGHYTLGQVLPFLPKLGGEREREYISGNHTFRVKMHSSRYKMFLDNLSCVRCGIVGSIFKLERMTDGLSDRAHFNLYAVHPITGEYVLMTKDHILPRAKGGKDSLYNYQTMCTYCNNSKGDTLEEKLASVYATKFTDWTSLNGKWIVTTDTVTGYDLEYPDKICSSGRAIDLKNDREIRWYRFINGDFKIIRKLPKYVENQIQIAGEENGRVQEWCAREERRDPQESSLSNCQ